MLYFYGNAGIVLAVEHDVPSEFMYVLLRYNRSLLRIISKQICLTKVKKGR